jgi:hypothetical protein
MLLSGCIYHGENYWDTSRQAVVADDGRCMVFELLIIDPHKAW